MRLRQVVFCISPSVIALAAIEKAGQLSNVSLTQFLQMCFSESERKAIDQSQTAQKIQLVHLIVGETEKGIVETLKQAKRGLQMLQKTHERYKDFREKMEEERLAHLSAVEPTGFWQEFEEQKPAVQVTEKPKTQHKPRPVQDGEFIAPEPKQKTLPVKRTHS